MGVIDDRGGQTRQRKSTSVQILPSTQYDKNDNDDDQNNPYNPDEDDVLHDFSSSLLDHNQIPKRVENDSNLRRRKKKRRRTRSTKLIFQPFLSDWINGRWGIPQFLFCWFLGILLVCTMILRTLLLTHSFSSDDFDARYYQSFAIARKNSHLYNETYTLAMERKAPPDQTAWPQYKQTVFELKEAAYASTVEECSLTIVIMEAKLSHPIYDYGPGQSLWFGLESIGAFAPHDACVVLMTTTCAMKEYLGSDAEDTSVKNEIIQGIYQQSLPMFRRFIESGRVRINFIDHKKVRAGTAVILPNDDIVESFSCVPSQQFLLPFYAYMINSITYRDAHNSVHPTMRSFIASFGKMNLKIEIVISS